MKLLNTKIKGLSIIKSKVFKDSRGFLRETYQKRVIKNIDFPFDIMSFSKKNVFSLIKLDILVIQIAPFNL